MGQRINVSRAMSAFRTDIKEILVESTLAGPTARDDAIAVGNLRAAELASAI